MSEQTCVECHRPMTVVDGRWVHQLGESGPCPPAICECGKNIHLVDAIWRHTDNSLAACHGWSGDPEDGPAQVATPRKVGKVEVIPVAELFGSADKSDPVNHPGHYSATRFAVECIAFTRLMSFSLGNAFKYVWRWQEKGGVEDLRKALVYLNWAIEDAEPKPVDKVRVLVNAYILPADWDHEVYGALVLIGYGHKNLAASVIRSTILELESAAS